MRLLDNIVLASAFISFAWASPLVQRQNKNFSVTQSVPKPFKAAGPIALARAYGKYVHIGAQVPAAVEAAAVNASQFDNGAVPTSPEANDLEYLSPVTIGGQTLNLDFDTGSSDLWVFSTEMPAYEQAGHIVYDPSQSSTSSFLSGYSFYIPYGGGQYAYGNVFTDTVDVGGAVVTGQAVELAQGASNQFIQVPDNDGILGLAFNSLNQVSPQAQSTFFSNAEPGLSAPIFTVNLQKGAPGTYDFGYIDDSQHTGDITYTPVDNSRGFWAFTTNGYAIGGNDFVSTYDTGIADTGTTLLLLPQATVDAYWSQVSGAYKDPSYGAYLFPCDSYLPDFTIGIENYGAVIPGYFMNYVQLTGSATCYGGIQSNAPIGFSIYGDIFLKSQFVVFDDNSSGNGPYLGFAPK